MEQQEFVPRSQSGGQQPLDEEEIDMPAQPYYWSSKPHTPKEEPASLYDVPMVENDTVNDYQSGYIAREAQEAQGTMTHANQGGEKIDTSRQLALSSKAQRQQSGLDGDAFEQQYHPNRGGNQQRGAPPFARTQIHRRNPARWIGFIVLGLFFFGAFVPILGAFLAIIGFILLAILVPILLILLVSIPFIIFHIGRRLGRINNAQRYRRNANVWRGPWGW